MNLKDKFKETSNRIHNKNKGGFLKYLDLEKFNLEQIKFERITKDYIFDILPYSIETKNHPLFGKQKETYNLEIFVHQYVGMNNDNFLCMKKMYNQNCEICNEFEKVKTKLEKDGLTNKEIWEEIKNLAYKHRILYHILYDGKKYIFDSPYGSDSSKKISVSFEKSWKSAIERKESKGIDVFPIYLNEDGCTSIEFTYNPIGDNFFEFSNFEFPVIKNYNSENVVGLTSLEKLLVIPDQQYIKDALLGNGEENNSNPYKEEEKSYNVEEADKTVNYYNEVLIKEKFVGEVVEPIKKKKKVENECPYGTKLGIDFDEYEHCDKCMLSHAEIYEVCSKQV